MRRTARSTFIDVISSRYKRKVVAPSQSMARGQEQTQMRVICFAWRQIKQYEFAHFA